MNKYNIQAIRNELEDYIRNSNWKSFRNRFQGLDEDLAQAIVGPTTTTSPSKPHSSSKNNNKHVTAATKSTRTRNKSSRRRMKPLLCHLLCYCRPPQNQQATRGRLFHANNEGIPLDVLEMVIHASPASIFTTSPTPLVIALEHGASMEVLETLLLYDTDALCVQDKSHQHAASGLDTPLLYSIKQGLNDDIVQLLIHSDLSRQSLLLCSPKRNRTPLFYVANEELAYMRGRSDEDADLPFSLQYILLQTHWALENRDDATEESAANNKKRKKAHNAGADNDTTSEAGDHGGFFCHSPIDNDENDIVDYNVNEKEHWLALLEATIATAHLLGTKSTAKLLAFLTPKAFSCLTQKTGATTTTSSSLASDENFLLHHVCRATEEQSFLDPNIPLSSLLSSNEEAGATSLVQALLDFFPQAALTFNHQGKLPLHLAIESNKSWQLLKHVGSPQAAKIPTNIGSLPLHMALVQYRATGGGEDGNNTNENNKNNNNKHNNSNSSKTKNATRRIGGNSNTNDDNNIRRSIVIMELWKLYPEATSVVDGVTRLFPFQLAAATGVATTTKTTRKSKSGTTQTNEKSTATSMLSDCYFFLRSAPQVLNQIHNREESV